MTHTNVSDLLESNLLESEKRLALYNPMFDSLKIEYDGVTYDLEAQKITRLPKRVGQYALKKLRDDVINKRGYSGSIYKAREDAEKEILV